MLFVRNYKINSYLKTQVATAIYEENADLSFYSLTKSPSLVILQIVLASYFTDKPVRISYDRVWDFKSMSKKIFHIQSLFMEMMEIGKLKEYREEIIFGFFRRAVEPIK
jgi:hypothetical protein